MRNQITLVSTLAFLALVGTATGSAAQDATGTPNHATFRGVVVDAVSGRAISGALVVIDDERRAVLTDEDGLFDFGLIEGGPLTLTARRYGYLMQGMDVVVPRNGTLDVEFPLPPEAVLVDGLEVVAERLQTMDQRLRSRRRALATSARGYEQDALVRTAARDFMEFLERDASLHLVPCGGRSFGQQCVWRRGRPVQPRVYVDELPILGGLDLLPTYQPYDMYLVEVFANGAEIRAYTHQFMERMARRTVALVPIFRWW